MGGPIIREKICMADRIAGLIALLVSVIYGFIAFTIIEAPFQYDPLGPESWPQILSVVSVFCCLYIILLPDDDEFDVARVAIIRLVIVAILLSGYAYLFEPVGFIISTALLCGIFSRLLGSTVKECALFGLATGVLGHIICVILLDLNLPGGLLSSIL